MLTGGLMKIRIQVTAILAACGLMLTGCNNGYRASSAFSSGANGSSGLSGSPEVVDMDALNKQVDEINTTVASVESELSKISLPGLGGSTQQGLDKNLRGIFDKLLEAVTKMFGRVGSLRTEINEKIAKLDPSNPLHLAAIAKLNEALSYVDRLEGQLGDRLHMITDRMRAVVSSFDSKIAAMDPKNPLSWVAMIAWTPVRTVLMEYIDKLDALAP